MDPAEQIDIIMLIILFECLDNVSEGVKQGTQETRTRVPKV